MGTYHLGRARLQVADRGVDQYVRRVAANIVCKQSHIAINRRYFKSEFGRGNNISSRKCYTGFRSWTYILGGSKQWKMYMIFGTWNARVTVEAP